MTIPRVILAAMEKETGDSLGVLAFNRVELIVSEDQVEEAARQFNEVLGLNLPTPHRIAGQPLFSATDFDGGLELAAPIGGEGALGRKLTEHGPGQIGPLVWEIEDADRARSWLEAHGYRIRFEYDNETDASRSEVRVHQLILDPEQWFGFSVTLMQRRSA
jgi:hypothetical protein